MLVIWIFAVVVGALAEVEDSNSTRTAKTFSLFSIVQFPNEVCTSSSSPTMYGTCYTASECTNMGGTNDGNCAAGFGVCCIISSTTCGSTISTNTTYIRNPSYPSAYTPSSTSDSCKYYVTKVQDDICQLRLDFQTFSGITAGTAGACTDSFAVAGTSGVDPPTICGTNTGHHMYVELGAAASDKATVTVSYGSTTADKMYNILLRQIACTATWRAPTDCVQYFTGASGNVKSYNFAGGQLLQSQYYQNCIRTEIGYCGIMWKENSISSPDPFQMSASPSTAASSGNPTACSNSYILIPDLSHDGISPIAQGNPAVKEEFYSIMCGSNFAMNGGTLPLALISRRQPFRLGVFTNTGTFTSPTTGFNMDYTQVPC